MGGSLRCLIFLAIFLLTACTPATETTLPTLAVLPTITPDEALLCEQLVQEVTQTVDAMCANIGRNEVCYGNTRLEVQPRPEVRLARFDSPGDKVSITAIESLRLSPLSTTQREWGLAILALQANLPDTLPGQNVLVFLFGDVEWRNTEQASAYYLRTGIGDAPCASAPESGILIQTPEGAAEIQVTINGVDIRLMSTAFIQAQPNAAMRVSLVEGQGIITAENVSRVVPAGTGITIPLNADLLPAAPPSEVAPYDAADFATLPIDILERDIEIAEFAEAEAVSSAEPAPTEEVILTEDIRLTEEALSTPETNTVNGTLNAETQALVRQLVLLWLPRLAMLLDSVDELALWLPTVYQPNVETQVAAPVENSVESPADTAADDTSIQDTDTNTTTDSPPEAAEAPIVTAEAQAPDETSPDDSNDDDNDGD